MNTTPDGIRTESERIRLVSIDVRHATSLHAKIGHPCLAGNWVSLSPPCRTRRMDALAKRVGAIA